MFTSHSLPPPSSFAHEHRPLRLTSDNQRPLPTGECRFILLHPSVQNQRCSCQSFHHNRNAPGSTCDCGHQSCYHVHIPHSGPEPHPTHDAFHLASQANLADRVRRLEEALSHERQIRDAAILEERRAREREVGILREALHPFYKSEDDMRRKLVELEDRLEGNYDEQLRWRERVANVDDVSMALEKRIDDLEGSQKKRRISRQPRGEIMPNGGGPLSKHSSNPSSSDDRLFPRPGPPTRSSPTRSLYQEPELESPRSSGVLNLVSLNRSPPYIPSRRLSPPTEEARSSGFLALDLAERLNTRKAGADQQQLPQQLPQQPSQLPAITLATGLVPLSATGPGHTRHPSRPVLSMTSIKPPLSIISVLDGPQVDPQSKRQTSVEVMEVSGDDASSPKKRKRPGDMMALDVLANVSIASPLA